MKACHSLPRFLDCRLSGTRDCSVSLPQLLDCRLSGTLPRDCSVSLPRLLDCRLSGTLPRDCSVSLPRFLDCRLSGTLLWDCSVSLPQLLDCRQEHRHSNSVCVSERAAHLYKSTLVSCGSLLKNLHTPLHSLCTDLPPRRLGSLV